MNGQLRGPCDRCQHVREGRSIAQAAFDAVLDLYKPMVRQSHIQKVEQEVAAQGEFNTERESKLSLRVDSYGRRPTSPSIRYCGVDEFAGKYYLCEVKNLDERCPQFTSIQTDSQPHSCATCRHYQAVPRRAVMALEQLLSRKNELRDVFITQATGEYHNCVDGDGLIHARPGFLPICVAQSSPDSREGQYLVGPVVNTSARCNVWSAGDNSETIQANAELDTLATRAKQAREMIFYPERYPKPSPGADLSQAVANAEGNLIAYCLRSLGLDSDYIQSFCSQHARLVWSREWKPAPDPQLQPSAPFLTQFNVVYQHPRHPELSLTVIGPEWEPGLRIQVGGSTLTFDRVPLDVWTQLRSGSGALPVTVYRQPIQGALYAVYAAWY